MNKQEPIFTERTECQDCYKCIRSCPVKAIKIEQGVASVMQELCIYCGTCVEVCPAGAKQVRNDLRHVKNTLQFGEQVIASLAPSWLSEFRNIPPAVMIHALKRLGFFGVSETALGAQEVSAHAAHLLATHPQQHWFSSACPVVVGYLQKYHPEHVSKLTGLLSPMLSHARLLKQTYGDGCKIVFIGPCIAKKREADTSGGLITAALTFEDLRRWLAAEAIFLERLTPARADVFIPQPAAEGGLYPVEGGMIAGMQATDPMHDARCMSLSGLDNVLQALDAPDAFEGQTGMFIELLACSGGCINGPKTQHRHLTIPKRRHVIEHVTYTPTAVPRTPTIPIETTFPPLPPVRSSFTPEEIRGILLQTGKQTEKDELNCGGCGYNSCREFARAVLEHKAETAMCITYMRHLAHTKANKLIKNMPSAVVIVDHTLQIIECNRNFARLAGGDTEEVYNIREGLAGAYLERILPISHLFRQVLESGEDLQEKRVSIQGRIIQCTLFSIERTRLVGGVLHDITEPIMKKDEITRRARKVIRDNLKTVQKIAYLLGENAADTEMILNSIIDTFNTEKKR